MKCPSPSCGQPIGGPDGAGYLLGDTHVCWPCFQKGEPVAAERAPTTTTERTLRAAPTPVTDLWPAVAFDEKGAPELPELPATNDTDAQCKWLTVVLSRDRQHPIIGGRRGGRDGPNGHVQLARRGAPPVLFDPATRLNTSKRLIETLSWHRIKTDGPPHGWKDTQCRLIAYVVGTLCDCTGALSAEEETLSILSHFLEHATLIDEQLTTYGNSGQRYEAASALYRDTIDGNSPLTPASYFRDINTGEYVISVLDLEHSARRQLGSSLTRGWLAAQLDLLGWQRIELQGYALPGRNGRVNGPHARRMVYRGLLPGVANDDEAVNT